MVSIASIVLLLGSLRPPCKVENVGEIWPPAANKDSGMMAQLAREGHLRICTLGLWRHQWLSPTVTFSQLHDEPRKKGHWPAVFSKR